MTWSRLTTTLHVRVTGLFLGLLVLVGAVYYVWMDRMVFAPPAQDAAVGHDEVQVAVVIDVRRGDTFRARRYLRELTAYYPEVGVSEEIIDVFLQTDLTTVVNLRG